MTTLRLRGRLATAALAVCAAGTAFGGLVAGLGVPAAASAASAPAAMVPTQTAEIERGISRAPGFLKASQLPQGKRYGTWKAGRTYQGMPRNPKFCLDGALPPAQTSYVTYRGKTNVAAEEFVTVTDSAAAAQALVASLRSQVQACYQEWLDTDIPQYRDGERKASWKRFGTAQVEDGLTVIGVFTVPPKGFVKTSHLYAIGRDGHVVVVLHLGVPGDRSKAPVKGFTKVGATGLRQAF